MLPLEIEKRIRRHKNNPSEIFGNLCYIFMRDLHLSFDEIINMPIPMANALLKRWEKQRKEEEKQLKKAKRRK